jgi:diguanylate cyclase (GGDEF)-like protein
MRAPPKPDNEQERLAYLQKLHILDTPIEARFDRITRLVCRSLGVPISAVTLIEEERQWFKSVCGADISEAKRSTSFCGYALLSDAPVIVQDTLQDQRFIDSPFVTAAPHVRFYAGYPLRVAENVRVGTLCVYDMKPRALSEEERGIMNDFTEMTQTELASIAVSQAHLNLIKDHAEAERRNLIDPLTRLWNKKAILDLLARETEICGRDGTALTVVRADISVNDDTTPVADQIMRRTAAALVSLLRPYDLIGRIDDTGFLILLHNCNTTDAHYALNRISKSIYAEDIVTSKGPRPQRLRIGAVSCSPVRGEDSGRYIALAEHALRQNAEQDKSIFTVRAE